MSDNLNLNQFKILQVPGAQDLSFFGGENTMSVLFDPQDTSTDQLMAGEGVELVDLGSEDQAGPPIVTVRANDIAPIFGVRLRNTKAPYASPGERCEIGVAGSVVWFMSASALNRGVKVSLVEVTPGAIQAIGTEALLGITLDKIAANGMGRVLLQCDGFTPGTTPST